MFQYILIIFVSSKLQERETVSEVGITTTTATCSSATETQEEDVAALLVEALQRGSKLGFKE